MIDLATTTKRYLNALEVMELIGVSRRTVYYWVEKGHLESIVIAGTIRISVNSLRQHLRIPAESSSPSVQSSQSLRHSA